MPEPTSTAPAIPEAESRRRWYRRPWVILTLAGLAILGCIPFVVRGYQLSLIPDIPDPFADLPPLKSPALPSEPDPVVDRYIQTHERCADWDNWIDAEEPDHEDYDQFREELRVACQNGPAASTPRIRRFYRDNAALIDLWFEALDRIATKSIPDRSSAIVALTDHTEFDLLQISAQEHLRQGNPEPGLRLYLRAAISLDRVQPHEAWEWNELVFFRIILWKAIVSFLDGAELDGLLLKEALSTTKSLAVASDDVRLWMFQAEYNDELESFRDPYYDWMSADFLSLPSSTGRVAAYILGEPDVSERILRHIYTGYRSQALLPRSERPPVHSLTVDSREIEWFDCSGTGTVHERVLKRAISHAPLMIHFGTSSSLFNLLDVETSMLQLVKTAIACQLYQRETGTFPRNLGQLVPRYLESVPVDPSSPTGSPLIYRINPHDVEIYSVGWNGTDDGGVNRDGGPRRSSYDPGFIVRDLAKLPAKAEGSEKVK